MNFLVYEMNSVKELRGEDREWVSQLAQRLQQERADPGSPYVRLFEALGAGFFKKRKDKQRLVAYRLDVPTAYGVAPVVVFLELLHRDDPRYENGKVEKFSNRFLPLLTARQQDIRRWAEETLARQSVQAPVVLPTMPDYLEALLQPLSRQTEGTGIFQSSRWNDLFKQASSTHKGQLHEALFEMVCAGDRRREPWRLYEHAHKDVVIHYVTLPDLQSNDSFHFYLLGFIVSTWSQQQRSSELQLIKENWIRFQDEVILPLQLVIEQAGEGTPRAGLLREFIDRVGRFSSCTYPDYLLADNELWEKLLATDSILLPLSFEELTALESLFSGERFPAIIEGRAGSGKTTLLSYYVPERLVRLPSGVTEPEKSLSLLYLTENPKLLKNTMETIGRLKTKLKELYNDPSLWLQEEFCTFHRYALGQLPDERKGRFWDISKNHMDFFRFRSLLRHPQEGLRARLSREVQNPEILWFVIRSYIKGFNLGAEGEERWMSPEQFATEEELSRRDRQVSQQVYEEVWEKVWPWYKRLTVPCSENRYQPRYWDNLDLAWEVLEHRSPHARSYAVLICDEVQDLTRVELAAIFQSSEFLKYSRPTEQAGRVPIILAGDSYQTINPACFRWARVKADCAKALVQQIPNAPLPRIEPFQLLYNYRNRPSIARLCNALQLLRQEIVGVAGELQRIWQLEDQPLNQAIRRLIIPDDGIILKDLFAKGVSFLGPEPPYVTDETAAAFWAALGLPHGPPRTSMASAHTPATKGHPSAEATEAKTLNYESPADVKGLEKPFYALLGFGTAFAQLGLNRFWEWDEYDREAEIPESQLLAAEYFLNRLYVAASRAREQLWIVETQQGWDAFWQPLEEWIQRLRTAPTATTAAQVSADYNASPFDFSWSPGSSDELVSVFRKEWPQMAQDYEEQAEALRHAEFAERAAYYYRLSGNTVGAQRALALKYYLEGQLAQAVQQILTLDPDKALQWAWEAAAWDILNRREFANSWQNEVARNMSANTPRSKAWCDRMIRLITQNQQWIYEDLDHARKSWLTWSVVITELIERAAAANLEEEQLRKVQQIGRQWQTSPHSDLVRFHKALAQVEYRLGCHAEAVQLWEKAGHTQHQDYFQAKAVVTDYPGNLQYLESAQQWKELLHQYDIKSNYPLSTQDRRRVLRACRELGRWQQAIEIAINLDNQDFVELWKSIVADSTVQVTDLRNYIHQAHQHWQNRFPEPDKVEPGRAWSLLMLDCLLAFQEIRSEIKLPLEVQTSAAVAAASTEQQKNARVYHPLLFGLTLEGDPRRLAGQFQRIWESRLERPVWWEVHKSLLQQLGPAGYHYVRRLWRYNNREEAALVAYLLCGLVWKTDRRTEET
ncbi:MAG: hypothetical protein NZU63_14880, partial [Gemmataceae bacterium]|nr:hypothetical protein [Gemmataceae bacterium]